MLELFTDAQLFVGNIDNLQRELPGGILVRILRIESEPEVINLKHVLVVVLWFKE